MTKPVHMHRSKKYSKYNILLLLIPIIFFGLVLATYILSKGLSDNYSELTSISEPSILGESKNLDK